MILGRMLCNLTSKAQVLFLVLLQCSGIFALQLFVNLLHPVEFVRNTSFALSKIAVLHLESLDLLINLFHEC